MIYYKYLNKKNLKDRSILRPSKAGSAVWSASLDELIGVPGIINALVTPDRSYEVFSFQQFRSDLYLVKGLQ